MRRHFIVISMLISILVSLSALVKADDANPCEQISNLYKEEVVNNAKLNQEKKDLEGELKKDEKTISRLTNDVDHARDSIRLLRSRISNADVELKQMKQLLSACRGDSANMRKELDSKKLLSQEQCQRRVEELQKLLESGGKKISELNDTIAEKEKQIANLKEKVALQEEIRKFYLQHFVKSSVDELYATSSINELERCREVLKMMNEEIPPVIGQTILCFEAKDLLSQKYNKAKVDQILKQLPMDTEIGKKLAQSLQQYANINAEASSVWATIQKEEFAQKVDTSNDHKHIFAKRKIWQHVQQFYNKYPSLLKEYPYVHEQYDAMLRAVWENANNFTKIANPFK